MQTTVIRRATPDDAAAIAAIYAYYVKNTAVTFENEPPGAEEIRERIETYSRRYPYLCITQGDTIIGFAFAHHFRERPAYDYAAEVSIYLHHDHRRGGAGTLIYSALENELKKMGVKSLYACIAVPGGDDPHLTNASPLFHEKCGYHLCGTFRNCGRKFNKWYDMIWMGKIIGDFSDDPQPLIPYPDLRERSL